MTQFEFEAALRDFTQPREAELEMRCEPVGRERVARLAEVGEHVVEVLPHEMRQHEIVVQARAPAAERPFVGTVPEFGHEAAQQRLLRHAHAPVRRHLEGAQLEQAATAGCGVRREELVDAELGAMGIAGRVDQQIAEHPIDQPGRGLSSRRDLLEGDLQLVQRIVARLVDTRMLAGRANEQARKEIGERGVV